MHFLTFIAAGALTISSSLVAFTIAGLWEVDERGDSTRVGRLLIAPLFVTICTSLILIDTPAISPGWLQYGLLLGVPAVLGFVARRLLARRLSGDSAEGD